MPHTRRALFAVGTSLIRCQRASPAPTATREGVRIPKSPVVLRIVRNVLPLGEVVTDLLVRVGPNEPITNRHVVQLDLDDRNSPVTRAMIGRQRFSRTSMFPRRTAPLWAPGLRTGSIQVGRQRSAVRSGAALRATLRSTRVRRPPRGLAAVRSHGGPPAPARCRRRWPARPQAGVTGPDRLASSTPFLPDRWRRRTPHRSSRFDTGPRAWRPSHDMR